MRVLKCALLLLISVALACLLGFGVLCSEINYCGRRDLAQPADAIVILGAKVLPDGQPGPDLRARTQHAVDLYRAGLAPRLICTGGIQDDPASAAAVCRALALSLDTPQQAIFLADGSANTEEDAQRVALVMSQYDWRTAILVSHPLHLYRARLFFEKEGLTVYTSPTTTDLDRIDLPLRAYYTIREGVGILWPYVEDAGLPKEWTDALQEYVYAGP